MKNKKNHNKSAMALSQIFILIFGMIAISYALGSEVGVVSAAECVAQDSEPRIEDNKVIFCYYKTPMKFTVTGDVNIQREDGRTYQRFGGTLWRYSGPDKEQEGDVDPSASEEWIKLANLALENYRRLKESSKVDSARKCIRYEFESQIYYGVYEEDYKSPTKENIAGTPPYSGGVIPLYYKDTKGQQHLASKERTWYIWRTGSWSKLYAQNVDIANGFIPSKTCDASLFPAEKDITDITPTSEDQILPGLAGLPFDLSNPLTWPKYSFSSETEETEKPLPATVKVGPPTGTKAVWQKAGETVWKCIENCKITGTESNKNACPNADCTGQVKNLCTHYYKDYLLKKGYTEPPGNCDEGYFSLNNDRDGDGVIDSKDAFPDDFNKYKEEEKETDTKEKDKTKDQNKSKVPYDLDKTFLGNWGYLAGGIAEGAAWAVVVYNGMKLIGGFFEEDEDLVNAWAMAFAGGVAVGKTTIGLIQSLTEGSKTFLGIDVGWWGVGVGAAYFLFAFRYETQEVITFNCQPWDSATGGDHCNECNNQGILPCSEYQCRSLGQGCELINQGTDEEKCAWVNRNDVEFPRIEAWREALINDDYDYVLQTTGISPPDTGVRIEYQGGDIPAFTPLSFGIQLTNEDEEPEPAKCKFDARSKDNFEEMDFFFSEGLLLEKHSYTLSLPGAGGDLEIENDGEYNIYVRCQDANGNKNVANFVFSFNVNVGPDTTPPLIVTTDPLNNLPFAFEQESVGINVYVNEPVQGCKWSHLDQSYENMEETMDCTGGDSLAEMNPQGLFACDTELSGLNDRVENKFYFRCEDLAGNVNEESYEYTLIGTEPLVIDWVRPEEGEVISDSTDSIKVTLEARTSVGYNDGRSNCYFSDTGLDEDYDLFYSDGDYENYEHTQDLWLPEGDYEYFIKCIDLGGNEDTMSTTFTVQSDGDAPIVIRAYKEEIYLKLITNEPANCAYDTKYENYPCDFNFDDGTLMTTLEDVNHYTDWNTATTFYIKCQDTFGNQPWPDGCSIIIRPSDLY